MPDLIIKPTNTSGNKVIMHWKKSNGINSKTPIYKSKNINRKLFNNNFMFDGLAISI